MCVFFVSLFVFHSTESLACNMYLTKCDYFHVQRVKLSQSRHFIFEFTLLPVLTVFRPPFCPKVDDVER